jgi:hypothetical protein
VSILADVVLIAFAIVAVAVVVTYLERRSE